MGNLSCKDIILKKTKTFCSEAPNKLKRSTPINESIVNSNYHESVLYEFNLIPSEIVLINSGFISGLSLINPDSNSDLNLSSKINSEISRNFTKKSSFFPSKQFEFENYEENLREKLIKTIQNCISGSKLIHLDELMVPFPLMNDLEKMKHDDYLNEGIEEVKKKVLGRYNVTKFTFYFATKENILEYILNCDNDDYCESFYIEENTYIGINFKMSKENILGVYFLYASSC